MKQYFILFFIIITAFTAMSQPDYPVAPPVSPNLGKLEYFFDTDPGAGNGIPVSMPASQDISSFSFDASLAGVANGFHRIYIRSMDANGKWSHTINAYFDNVILRAYAPAPMPAGNIVDIEYFIDTDPGIGNAHKISVLPGTDLNNENIALNVSGLAAGVHRLYIRSKDENGKWSLTNFSLFDNSQATPYPLAPPPAPPVGEMEYYIDTDPGFGNATPVTFTAGTDISNLSIDIATNSISQGAHTLYIRSRQNPWSFSAHAEFLFGSVLPLSWLYVKGELKSEAAVISWATATESNTKEFVVEHSADGIDFEATGQLPAAGNSNFSETYSYTHAAPDRGFNYYRIKQVDLDGQFSYSKIITLLNIHAQKSTVIGPNPVKDVLNIIEPAITLVKKMEIYDMNGRVMISSNIAAENNLFSMPTGTLTKGNYVLKVFYKDSIKTFKILKQ